MNKASRIAFYNLLKSFRGPVYGVNIKGGEILGRKLYKSLNDLPEVPDLVVVATPAPTVPDILKEAEKLGVGAAIVLSGGFGEVGRRDLDEKLLDISIPFLGPNCVGLYTPHMNATFLSPDRMLFPPEGSTVIISQSGAVLAALLDEMAARGMGVRAAISLGNKLKLDEVDFLRHFSRDPHTESVLLYLEGVQRGRELYEEIKRMGKKVVVIKGGRTTRGKKATKTHTEAVVNDYAVFEGAMEQAGAAVVKTPEQALNLLSFRGDKKRCLFILTNGGGYGVLASDLAEEHGIKLCEWNAKLELPPHVVQSNPFDITGTGTPEDIRKVLDSLQDCLVLAIIVPQTPTMDPSFIRVLSESKNPVVAVIPGGKYAEALRELLRREGVATFSSLREAMDVVRAFISSVTV
jgi:acyl-CoA synthetase (NDP forming)